MKAYLEQRSQKAKGRFPKQGPNTYIAVQVVPNGIKPLVYLNKNFAKKRGIKIKYFGEGYSNRTGPNSMLYKALQEAKIYCDTINFIEKGLGI